MSPTKMTPEAFSNACSELAKKADAAPLYGEERAKLLDEIGRLFAENGFPEAFSQSWHGAASCCRKGP